MKKFIYPLAAVAALFTGNLYAQDAVLSNSQKGDAKYDCVKSVSNHNRTLVASGEVVTQTFEACETGTIDQVNVTAKNLTDGATYGAQIVNSFGYVMDRTSFGNDDLKNGTITLDLNVEVHYGKTYSLQLTAPQDKPMGLRYESGPRGTLTKDGDAVNGELAMTMGIAAEGMQHVAAASQTRGGNTENPGTRALSNECKVAVNGFDNTISLDEAGHFATQALYACSEGTLKQVSLKLRAYGEFQGSFEITNNRGASIFSRRVSARDGENGELFIPVNIPVEQGERLTLKIKALNNAGLLLHGNSKEKVGKCTKNGAELGLNLEFTAHIEMGELQDDTSDNIDAVTKAGTKVTTYPNPFTNQLSVRLENAGEGNAVVQLLDFSGNVLRSDVIDVKEASEEISFDTNSISRAGYYALRIIQGDDVKNVTVMKR